jgi:hypothetical protein
MVALENPSHKRSINKRFAIYTGLGIKARPYSENS